MQPPPAPNPRDRRVASSPRDRRIRALQRRWARAALARAHLHRHRPARRQQQQQDEQQQQQQNFEYTRHSAEYNIWYHKRLSVGQNTAPREARMKSATRCSAARDAGYTLADSGARAAEQPFFCLYFARGHCTKGPQCGYLHRVPEFADAEALPTAQDCFGRDRFRDYRDDMGGVGSIGRNNRTLFIGNFAATDDEVADKKGQKDKKAPGAAAVLDDSVFRRTFAEFGDLEYVKIFWDRCFAFARYACRAQAEFAKEALMDQTFLDDPEGRVLSIRWAHEDPNPAAIENERMNILAEVTQAVMAARSADEELFEYDDDDDDGNGDRRGASGKTDSDGPGADADLDAESRKRLDFFPAAGRDETAYPNTDKQYAQHQSQHSVVDEASVSIARQFLEEWVRIRDLGMPAAASSSASASAAGPSARPDEASRSHQLEAMVDTYARSLVAGGAVDAAALARLCTSVARVQTLGVADEQHASAITSAAAKLRETLAPAAARHEGAGSTGGSMEASAPTAGAASSSSSSAPTQWQWDANSLQWYYTDSTGRVVYYNGPPVVAAGAAAAAAAPPKITNATTAAADAAASTGSGAAMSLRKQPIVPLVDY